MNILYTLNQLMLLERDYKITLQVCSVMINVYNNILFYVYKVNITEQQSNSRQSTSTNVPG